VLNRILFWNYKHTLPKYDINNTRSVGLEECAAAVSFMAPSVASLQEPVTASAPTAYDPF
jgi:hypothetical protein